MHLIPVCRSQPNDLLSSWAWLTQYTSQLIMWPSPSWSNLLSALVARQLQRTPLGVAAQQELCLAACKWFRTCHSLLAVSLAIPITSSGTPTSQIGHQRLTGYLTCTAKHHNRSRSRARSTTEALLDRAMRVLDLTSLHLMAVTPNSQPTALSQPSLWAGRYRVSR